MRKILFYIAIPFVLISCGESYIYKETAKFEEYAWAYQDTLTFAATITDTTKLYSLYLDIDHTTDYLYQNIYMNIYTLLPNGTEQKARVNVNFAEPDGKWTGKCRGKNCTIPVVIQEKAYFSPAGTYTFIIEQFTRNETIQDIKGITFKIKDSGETR